MVLRAGQKVKGCSGKKREEDKREGKEINQKRMGRGKVMGKNQGRDELVGLEAEVERGSKEGKV